MRVTDKHVLVWHRTDNGSPQTIQRTLQKNNPNDRKVNQNDRKINQTDRNPNQRDIKRNQN